MQRAHLLTVVVPLCASSLLLSCSRAAPPPAGPAPAEPAFGGAGVSPGTALGVDRWLASLSARDQIAQLVMPWIPGNYAPFDDSAFTRMQAWVDSLHVGGIIISVGSPVDVAVKLNRLQSRSRLPLLVAADLEGGTSIRLQGGTPFPTNMGVGAGGMESDAYTVGRITALEGRAVGIHLTFAPVADVNNNPSNPIINTRSFGEDPKAVARLVAASVRGIQDNGMLATAKHFPGHGDTGTDSHLALPVIDAGWERFDSLELVPFRAAVEAGVGMVMSAHIAVPALELGDDRPATLEPQILTGLLRDSLHFKGVIVTDALNMGGVVNRYGPGEATVLAFLAGADLLLQPADPATAIEAMAQAVESGRISRERLERSVRRVLELKRRLGLFQHRLVPVESVPLVVGKSEFQVQARDIAERSIVLVDDSLGTVDSLRMERRTINLITYGDENSPAVGLGLANGLRAAGHSVSTFRLWPASGPPSYDSARVAIGKNGIALFAAAVRATAWRGTIALPALLAVLIDESARLRPTVLVSFGSPYIIQQTPHVGSYVLGWTSNPATEWAMARALSGQSVISGHLPVSIPPWYNARYGLQRLIPDELRQMLSREP